MKNIICAAMLFAGMAALAALVKKAKALEADYLASDFEALK